MKRLNMIALLLSALCILPLLSLHAAAYEEPVLQYADHAYVYNFEHDTVLFSQKEDDPIYPGPTVKLMTALLALEAFNTQLDMEITITGGMLSGVTGSRINLRTDEVVTAGQLLNAMIVGNANDAATALAVVIAGSVESFVTMMNTRAVELGATHTNYTNPTGIHNSNMYTTVSDIALIAKQLYQYSLFRSIAKQVTYTFPETNKSAARTIYNRNFLIATNIEYKYYTPSATGMNAGNTAQSGYSVVATCEYESGSYLVIVMGASYVDGEYYSFYNARSLVTWARSSFADVTILRDTSFICEVPVSMAEGVDYVTLLPQSDVTLYLPTDIDYETQIKRTIQLDTPTLTAPVEKGTKVGTLTLIYQGEVIAEVPLVTKSNIERNEQLYWLSLFTSFFRADWVIPALVLIVLIALACIMFNAFRLQQQKKKTFVPKDETKNP